METSRVRTNRELLKLMLKRQDLFHSGLCYWADGMETHNLITRVEYHNLGNYIKHNRPFKQNKKQLNYLSVFFFKINQIYS